MKQIDSRAPEVKEKGQGKQHNIAGLQRHNKSGILYPVILSTLGSRRK
jgi:hypothetical protein